MARIAAALAAGITALSLAGCAGDSGGSPVSGPSGPGSGIAASDSPWSSGAPREPGTASSGAGQSLTAAPGDRPPLTDSGAPPTSPTSGAISPTSGAISPTSGAISPTGGPTAPGGSASRPATPTAPSPGDPSPTGPVGFTCSVDLRGLPGGLHEVAVFGPATLSEVWVRITWGGDSAAGVVPMIGGTGSRIIPGIPATEEPAATVYTDASLTQPACASS